ncbi:hypothetical protein LCGC14_2039600 [marine sediment metagenome]|uniref:Uncharacterized protein n=1 Tax=marine sediment metagenome TaxID=412755 RepID=A0A0F9FEW2_9ZZZZ
MTKVEDYQYLRETRIDMNFPCIVCSANHTHFGKYAKGNLEGTTIRYCEDCLEHLGVL